VRAESLTYDEFYTFSSPVNTAEYQRLLRDYPENTDLVRSIGATHYQVVNVVQYRHHQPVSSISTREGMGKGPRSQGGMQAMQQTRVKNISILHISNYYETKLLVPHSLTHSLAMWCPMIYFHNVCENI